MATAVEVRGVIASKQGLSCEGYYMLSNRTVHLRERLYVSVADGARLFLPKDPNEHFPCAEIEDYYVKRLHVGFFQSIGAGGGEVVFICEGLDPAAADEGATAITAALPEVDAAVNLPLLPRWNAAIPQKRRYIQTTSFAASRAYRPERIPERAMAFRAPAPSDEEVQRERPETLAESLARFEQKKREALAGWGLLADYDRAKAQKRAPNQAHWQQTRWKEAHWM